MSKYWNQEGTYQAQYNTLFDQLVPSNGRSTSLAGELLRAATRVYYDAFNNGFLNNTSGAINFLITYLRPYYPADCILDEALQYIAPKTNTCGYSDVDSKTEQSLDIIVDYVLKLIIEQPSIIDIESPCDLFDLSDEDYQEEDEDKYSDYSDCEEEYEE